MGKSNMNISISDYVVSEIKAISPDTLVAHHVIYEAKKTVAGNPSYVCPTCENGTGHDGTGILPNRKNGVWLYHCFRCNETFDNIHLLALHYNLNPRADFQEICRLACNEFNIYPESNYQPLVNQTNSYVNDRQKIIATIQMASNQALRDNTVQKGGQGRWTSTEKAKKSVDKVGGHPPFEKSPEELANEKKEFELIRSDISNAQANLDLLPDDARRGLSLETLRHFNCGYLNNWTSPKSRVNNTHSTPTPRLIVPSGNHYLARLIVPLSSFDEHTQKYIQPKQHAGAKFPFNFKNISPDNVNIIVEGEIDAMSIWQATKGKFPVVATSGATGYGEFVRLVKENFSQAESKPQFLILFDPDEAGRNNSQKLHNALKFDFPVVCSFLSEEISKIDANDILREQGQEKLAELIDDIVSNAKSIFEKLVNEIAEESARKEKISEWIGINGEIESTTLNKLQSEADYLKSLTVDKITSALVNESKTLYAIAACQFYDFYRQVADEFIARVYSAKSEAKKAVKNATPDKPVTDSVIATAMLDLKAISDAIKKIITQIAKSHKNYTLKFNAEKEKIEHEQRIQAAEQYRADSIDRLKYLQMQPQTIERDNEMRQIIADSCSWREDKYGNRISVLPTMANYDLIFTYDPVLNGLFAYDEFKQADVFTKPVYWRKNFSLHEAWQDSDDANLRVYLRRNYTDISNENLYSDTFQSYSWEHSFHVVKDYLNNLPAWDGVPRAETLFIKFLRVEDTHYSREVTMNWLFGALARIFHPGCEYQTALVLNGAQKIGKSTLAKLLGGKWHAVLKDSVEDSHAIDVLQSAWIVELEEFWAGGKAAVNALKAFISANADDRREVYARKAKKFLRHCVFIITCNDQQFLKDKTGNRRFMVLKCLSKKFDYVEGLTEEYIQQVWAEALYKFNEKFADGFDANELQLSAETQQRAEEIAETFTIDDSLDGEINAFLNVKIPPYPIWKILTKEERHKFFLTNSIALDEDDWQMRKKKLKPNEIAEFDAALANKKFTRKMNRHTPYGSVACVVIYGSVYRTETCAAEIFNECFGNDKRKTMFRINEVLSTLEGWILSENRSKDFHDCYGDQRRIYSRKETPIDFESKENNFSADMSINDMDLPF